MSVHLSRLWWAAVLAAIAALVVELVIWFVPELLRASREPAHYTQFCLVLDIRTDIACITVTFQTLSAALPNLPRADQDVCCISELLGNHNFTWAYFQVAYQHSPGGIGQLYLWPGQPPDHQGTLSQRQAYTGQYEVWAIHVSLVSLLKLTSKSVCIDRLRVPMLLSR